MEVGKQEMEVGKQELDDGKQEMEVGKQELEVGKQELAVGECKFSFKIGIYQVTNPYTITKESFNNGKFKLENMEIHI